MKVLIVAPLKAGGDRGEAPGGFWFGGGVGEERASGSNFGHWG